jgi:hypothetical protein
MALLEFCQYTAVSKAYALEATYYPFDSHSLNVWRRIVCPLNPECMGWIRLVQDSSPVKGKAVPLHAMEALGGRGGIAPTHSRPRH